MKTLAIFAGQILVIGAMTILTPYFAHAQGANAQPSPVPPAQNVKVVNSPSDPVPVAGTVNVGNLVNIRKLVPETAFSRVRYFSLSTLPFVGPDPEGTSYAITSLTISAPPGSGTTNVTLRGISGDTVDCVSFSPNAFQTVDGPTVFVAPQTTVHLSFPQPFIIPARMGAVSCLQAVVGAPVWITVVGYRL